MQSTVPSNRHILLAVQQNFDLIAHVAQPTQHLAVSVYKAQDGIRHTGFGTKFLDHALDCPQVVPGHARKQVVDCLELQAAVDKVQPGGTVNIERGAQLPLGKRLGRAELRGGHAPVREGELDVQRHGDHVGDGDKGHAQLPGRQAAPDEHVAVQEPVARHEANLGRPDPPRRAARQPGRLGRQHVAPRERVEQEPRNAHGRVEGVLLIRHQEAGGRVPHKDKVVVRRPKRLEERGARGK